MTPNLIERLLRRSDPNNPYAAPVDADRRLMREAANELSALRSRIEIRAGKEVMP